MFTPCILLTALVAGDAPAEAPAGNVSLSHQRAQLDLTTSAPALRFSATAHNELPVRVESVRVGILFAASGSALAAADASALYRRGAAKPGAAVGVVDRAAPVVVPPGSAVAFELAIPLDGPAPEPQAFRTHVLGYTLSEASATLLLGLLDTQAAADEVAAVSFLALDGDAPARLAVRRRWGKTAELVRGFAAELERPIPERPSERDTFRRLFAARALGVLGGRVSARALRKLAADSGLERFDEPLQVLRIARLMGSRLETPLAFAIPPGAQRMADVVGLAIEDAVGLEESASVAAAAETAIATDAAPAPAAALGELAPDVVGTMAVARDLAGAPVEAPSAGAPRATSVILGAAMLLTTAAILAGWAYGRRARRRGDS